MEKKRNKNVRDILILTAILTGIHIFFNVLPYYIPNQWEPANEPQNMSGQYDFTRETGEFHGRKVTSSYIYDRTQKDNGILGDFNAMNKHVEVDLTNQRVYAYENGVLIMNFLVSTGKWGRTPTGIFTIERKIRAQVMDGGSRVLGTYYYLPNVQFVQYFGNDEVPWSRGFSFHGTYWHSNFGTPMSHGCINMTNEDAQTLYYWTNPLLGDKQSIAASEEDVGTTVIIYGEAP